MQETEYGIDWDGPAPSDSNESTVVVPDIQEILSPEERQVIQGTLEQLVADSEGSDRDEDYLWLEQYIVALHFLKRIVS